MKRTGRVSLLQIEPSASRRMEERVGLLGAILFELFHSSFRSTDSWLGTGTRFSSSSTLPSQFSHRRLRRTPLHHGVAHRIVLAGMTLYLNILHRIPSSARHWRSMLAICSLLCRRLGHLEIWASCGWMFFNKLSLQSACRRLLFFGFHCWFYPRVGWSLRRLVVLERGI